MRYKAILFDMDGTLLDTLTDMADAVNHILSVHGWPLRTIEEVRAFVGNGARRLMERAVPPEVTGGDFEAVLTEYRDWYQTHNCVATAPYPGIPALLAALAKAGIKTAVVSNKPDEAVRPLVAEHFGALADIAMGETAQRRRKPAPDMVNDALAALGADKSRAVYVGDSEVDIETARNAGIPCISVTWGFRDREQLVEAKATELAADAGELHALLEK